MAKDACTDPKAETHAIIIQQPSATDDMVKKIVPVVLGALILFLSGWVWRAESRLAKIEEKQSNDTKFWRIHNQTKTEINEINVKLDRPLFDWDISEQD